MIDLRERHEHLAALILKLNQARCAFDPRTPERARLNRELRHLIKRQREVFIELQARKQRVSKILRERPARPSLPAK